MLMVIGTLKHPRFEEVSEMNLYVAESVEDYVCPTGSQTA
jgi:hypothetical protein